MVGKRPGGSMRRLAVLVTTFGLALGGLLAAGVPASAQSDAAPKATDIGVTAKEIRIAVVADVDNPFAPSLFQGGVNGVKAAVEYVNSHGGIAGRKLDARRHRLAAQPREDAQRGHHRVPERLRARRHGRRVHDHDRGRGQLPGPGGQGDRPARLRRLRHRRAAVLTGCVPREPAPARVLHQGRPPADVLRRLGRFEVLREARGNEAARALPREQRQRGGDSSTGPAARVPRARRHEVGPAPVHLVHRRRRARTRRSCRS